MSKNRRNKEMNPVAALSVQLAGGAWNIVSNRHMLLAVLTAAVFFGLIAGAHYRVSTTVNPDIRQLSVLYRGDARIGEALSGKGIDFMIQHRMFRMDDQGLLAGIYGFYSSMVDVRKVCYVKKSYPDRIEVKVELRDPFVKVDEMYFDRDGVRLAEGLPRDLAGVPVMSGVCPPADLEPGDTWQNTYFQEALTALAAVCAKVDVTSVAIPARDGSFQSRGILLRTREGPAVFWGKVFNESPDPGTSVEKKVRNLDSILRLAASNMERVRYVDISRDKPVIAYK